MDFFTKLKEDKWFALANITLAGIVAYLAYDNYQSRRTKSFKRFQEKSFPKQQSSELKQNIHRNIGEFPIYKICVTGGPCGGKTTAIEDIKQVFTNKGFRVFVVPEIPTMIVLSGGMILMAKLSADERIHFQGLLIKLQMYIQDYFTKLAAMSKLPSIILCDRGVMDPYAYVTNDEFQTLLDEQGWNIVNLRDKRYDSVIFMVTAADGAQEHYTLANNIARSQGIETARQLDKKTQIAWSGHPHISIIPNVNGETFKNKVQRAINVVQKTIGLSTSSRYNTKLLIKSVNFPPNFQKQSFEVEQTYLVINDPETFIEDKIRKRGQNNSFTYGRTFKYNNKKQEQKDEIKRPITSLEYLQLISTRRDKTFRSIKKERITFVYEKQSFIIDKILLEEPICMLRFSSKSGEEKLVKIPEWIEVGEDVTRNPKYTTYEIAKIKQ